MSNFLTRLAKAAPMIAPPQMVFVQARSDSPDVWGGEADPPAGSIVGRRLFTPETSEADPMAALTDRQRAYLDRLGAGSRVIVIQTVDCDLHGQAAGVAHA